MLQLGESFLENYFPPSLVTLTGEDIFNSNRVDVLDEIGSYDLMRAYAVK